MSIPDSLFSRTTLVIALVSILFQLFTIAVITYFALIPLGRHATEDLTALMTGAAQSWHAASAGERPTVQDRLRRTDRLQVQDPPATAQNFPHVLPYFFFLESALSARFGQPIQVLRSTAANGEVWYWADLPTGGEIVRVGFPASRVSVQPSLALLIILAVGAVVTLITAAWMAHWLTQPLARLAAATQCIGQGQRPAPLPGTGPSELAALAHAFNRMGEQVEDLLANRTTLLVGISHDLRSPLARIQLALGMLSEKPDRDLLERIQRDVEGMNCLIARCLEVGRDFAEKDEVELNLCELIAEIAREHVASGVEIRGHKGSECCLHVRPMALRRILVNLLDNAVRYGDGRYIDIEYDVGEDSVEIRILDRGQGIPESERDAVFQPFRRLDSSRSSQTGGSGLGLAIVRQIANANGWQVMLDARPGGGTIARVRLPIQRT